MHWSIGLFMLVCLLTSTALQAVEQIYLDIPKLTGPSWQFTKLRLVLDQISNTTPHLLMSAEQVVLPSPLKQLSLLKLRCTHFNIQSKRIQCEDGRIELNWGGKPLVCKFIFLAGVDQSYFHLSELRIAKGRMRIDGTAQGENWQVQMTAENISMPALQKFLQANAWKAKNGQLDASLTLNGKAVHSKNAALTIALHNATLQTVDGRYAAEQASLKSTIKAQQQNLTWFWQSHLAFDKGAVYLEPIYVTAPVKKALEVNSMGHWLEKSAQFELDQLDLIHPGVGSLSAHGSVIPSATKWLKRIELTVDTSRLASLGNTYLAPFLVGTVWEGLSLDGTLRSKLTLQEQVITELSVDLAQFDIRDPKHRLGLTQASTAFRWKNQAAFKSTAFLKWQQLEFYSLSLDAAELNFDVTNDRLKLTKPVDIGFLHGNFAIDHFDWRVKKGQEPEVHFSGALEKISLEQLSKALDWMPLTGTISGNIPGIRYQNRRLDLEGALKIQVFDGEIGITQLAVANMLSDVPKFYSDIQIERLNLKQLTEKFKFGSIEGQLSGTIKNLYLENWHPVTFYAWLGTPERDTSVHKISQKAVDNIASIGGGGATNAISRTILGMFDSFGYSKLGLGCYLHAGVCQLMGLEATQNGYYMIKGGGLPKIDVIGYNPKVDWKVLVDRLGRVSSSESVIVE